VEVFDDIRRAMTFTEAKSVVKFYS
jgi:hypothetical protein